MRSIIRRVVDKGVQKNVDAINAQVLNRTQDSYDGLTFANIRAAAESATYFAKYMGQSTNFISGLELLTNAMTIRGLILEFGVTTGRTINHIASLTNETSSGLMPSLDFQRTGGRVTKKTNLSNKSRQCGRT
jgi:hypothetical protein